VCPCMLCGCRRWCPTPSCPQGSAQRSCQSRPGGNKKQGQQQQQYHQVRKAQPWQRCATTNNTCRWNLQRYSRRNPIQSKPPVTAPRATWCKACCNAWVHRKLHVCRRMPSAVAARNSTMHQQRVPHIISHHITSAPGGSRRGAAQAYYHSHQPQHPNQQPRRTWWKPQRRSTV
jgi:hypothetical protein